MLSMSPMASGQERYYLELTSIDYYTKGGEAPGRWHGKAAESLGLAGRAIAKDQLSALFRGYAPDGKRLVQNAGAEKRQPGLDLTFSMCKSASVLRSISSSEHRDAIQRAFDESCHVALDFFEQSVAVSRRGHAGAESESVQGITAIFSHAVSRANEPNYHNHCLVINAGHRQDGTWGALDGRPIFQAKMALGALQRAHFAHLLDELGLEVTPVKTWFEVAGVSKAICTAFSTRRQQLLHALCARKASGPIAAEIACKDTRPAKSHAPLSELIPYWRSDCAKLGLTRKHADAMFCPTKTRPVEIDSVAMECIADIQRERSCFTQTDVIRAVAERCQDGRASGRQIVESVARAIGGPSIERFADPKGQEYFITAEAKEIENNTLAIAKRSTDRMDHSVRWGSGSEPAFRYLSYEQAEAVKQLTCESGSIQCLSGMAGTGKTSTLRAAAAVWKRSGYKVVGCALAGKAARELERGSGIQSETLRKTLFRLDPSREFVVRHEWRQLKRAMAGRGRANFDRLRLTKKTVVVLDEASMVGTPDLQRLMSRVERAGAKLILVGDEKQLPSIESGAPFRAIMQITGAAKLVSIVRQRHEWMRRAVESIADGDVRGGLSLFALKKRFVIGESKRKTIEALVASWIDNRSDDITENLILAGTNADAGALNTRVQEELRARGELGRRSVTLRHGNDAPNERLSERDRVMFLKNDRRIGVMNGELGTVEHIALHPIPGLSTLTVRLDEQERRGLFHVHKRVTFRLRDYDDLALGYCATTHKAQGATVDRSFVLLDGQMQSRELTYVQMSRAREETWVFATKQDAGEDLTELVRAAERSRPKLLAVEIQRAPDERSIA